MGIVTLRQQSRRDGHQATCANLHRIPRAVTPTPRYRYQLDSHLGTVAVEVDQAGSVISYEEYHPYGTSAYRSENLGGVSQRRYRYTGK